MPRFPKKEADIVALAEWLWRGLFGNHPVYPQPPVHPIWLPQDDKCHLAFLFIWFSMPTAAPITMRQLYGCFPAGAKVLGQPMNFKEIYRSSVPTYLLRAVV
jgi:hypothetical protein